MCLVNGRETLLLQLAGTGGHINNHFIRQKKSFASGYMAEKIREVRKAFFLLFFFFFNRIFSFFTFVEKTL